jgi:hypothetical protein
VFVLVRCDGARQSKHSSKAHGVFAAILMCFHVGTQAACMHAGYFSSRHSGESRNCDDTIFEGQRFKKRFDSTQFLAFDIVAAFIGSSEYIVKRLFKHNGRVELRPENPNYCLISQSP